MSTEAIEREMVIEAPAETVWDVITQPEQITRWFSDTAEVELREGGRMTLGFPEHNHTIEAVVVQVERPRVFAWRWIQNDGDPLDDRRSTYVRFTLTEEGEERTRLAVLETGFDKVEFSGGRDPAEVRASHVEGWAEHTDTLVGLFADRESAAR